MISMPNLIIIGGSSRNVGKTSICLDLISRYASKLDITGLKISAIKPEEKIYHGTHGHVFKGRNFRIYEEPKPDDHKDTARMLKAGAKRAVYIEAADEHLAEAFAGFRNLYGTTGPIISESRSLRKLAIPSLFILIKHFEAALIKQDFYKYEALADLTVNIKPGCNTSASVASRIFWDQDHWALSWN